MIATVAPDLVQILLDSGRQNQAKIIPNKNNLYLQTEMKGLLDIYHISSNESL